MAIAVMTWVLEEAPELPGHCFAVLMALASKAREDGTGARPGQQWLADRTRKTARQVRSDLAKLEELDLIRRGDQSLVAHLPADEAPVVWDLAIERLGRKPASAPSDDVESEETAHESTDAGRERKPASGRQSTSGRKQSSGGERKQASGDTSLDTTNSPPTGERRASASANTRTQDAKSTGTKRGTRLPADFARSITPDLVAWVRKECPDVDGKDQTNRFVDYWVAIPGAKGLKLDWVATWKNWMRRQQDDYKPGKPNGRASPGGSKFAEGSGQMHMPPADHYGQGKARI